MKLRMLVSLLWAGAAATATLAGCRPEAGNASGNEYFSLRTFISEQQEILKASHARLKKVATLDGKTDSTELAQPRWERELALFADADISKPALKGEYKIDTLRGKDGLQITYTATDTSLNVRQLLVVRNRMQQVTHVVAHQKSDNLLLDSDHMLELFTTEVGGKRVIDSYTIKSVQASLLSDPANSLVSAQVVR